MTSTAMLHQSSPPEQDDFGLNEIARHNAQQAQPSTEEFPAYQEDAKGLGIYVSICSARDFVLESFTHIFVARWISSSVYGGPVICPQPTDTPLQHCQ
jgi:hypothetical protein